MRLTAALVLVPLLACESELELAAGSATVARQPEVTVRTRSVCGNGVVEGGEECDGDGDCNDHCQVPCAIDVPELVSCDAGRAFDHQFTLYSETFGRDVEVSQSVVTLLCRGRSGDPLEIAACTDGACLNILSPADGAHVCAEGCETSGDCPSGTVCVPTVVGGETPSPTGPSVCVSAVGGRVGDECNSPAQCGGGLNCNLVSGYDGYALCMPGDCEDNGDCPRGAVCAPALNAFTRDQIGESCFANTGWPLGARTMGPNPCEGQRAVPVEFVGEACVAGCLRQDDCGACIAIDGRCMPPDRCIDWCREVNAQAVTACLASFACGRDVDHCFGQPPLSGPLYCTESCQRDGVCPEGAFCSGPFGQGGDRVCLLERARDTADPPNVGPALVRSFPDPECADDIDSTCTFESRCDADCGRRLGCGEVPEPGLCDGTRLLFCERDRVISVDCAARELGCAYDEALARFDCLGLR